MPVALHIIFSQFDEKKGPISKAYYPETVLKFTQSVVSSMTIDLLTYTKKKEEESNYDELQIMSFPQLNKKGLVRILEWKDPSKRGGIQDATLTILFEERDDSILYKYKADIEEKIKNFLVDFLPVVQNQEPVYFVEDKLGLLHKELGELLDKLSKQELNVSTDSSAFPQTGEQEEAIKAGYAFKTILIGDPGVGKTSMILQFTEKAFRRSYIPTIGAQITEKTLIVHQSEFHLLIWDLAGQSKFQTIRTLYYNGANCVVIVFDLTNPDSFENIKKWYQDVKNSFKDLSKIEIILCGNKSDLVEERQVTIEQTKSLTEELNVEYLETSALNGKNIKETFINMINNMILRGIIKL